MRLIESLHAANQAPMVDRTKRNLVFGTVMTMIGLVMHIAIATMLSLAFVTNMPIDDRGISLAVIGSALAFLFTLSGIGIVFRERKLK